MKMMKKKKQIRNRKRKGELMRAMMKIWYQLRSVKKLVPQRLLLKLITRKSDLYIINLNILNVSIISREGIY